MDKEHPGWREQIVADEYDDAFRDPVKEARFKEDWEVQGLKQFEEWLTQNQKVIKE
jgi:hypothetical protein